MEELLLSSVAACVLSVLLKPPIPRAKNPPPPPVGKVPPVGNDPPPLNDGRVVVVVVWDVVGATVRVTMMSVPTDPSGDRTLFWASESPCETPMMPITRPTPAASPKAVTSVRPQRRRSSFQA